MEEIVRPIFDWTDVSEYFPPVKSKDEQEAALAQVITKRLEEITPSAAEQALVQGFFTKVTTVIENLIVAGEGEELLLDEVLPVGSQKKGVALAGCKTADAVIIYKKPPTDVMVTNLGVRVADILNSPEANVGAAGNQAVTPKMIDKMTFQLESTDGVTVIVYATTTAPLLAQLPTDSEDMLVCMGALRMVRHVRWFDEHVRHAGIRQLIRLIKDLKCREEAFQALNPWHLELLCHCASVPLHGGDIMPVAQSYKRVFQLLSAGLFLPGSIGIPDPCEEEEEGIHTMMTSSEQDQLAGVAQMMLRMLHHGAVQQVLAEGGVLPADFRRAQTVGSVKVLPPLSVITDKN